MHTFFDYQQRTLDILKYWGLSSVAVGALCTLVPDKRVRHFGYQAATWGAIDAKLAIFGQYQASQKATRFARGELDAAVVAREIERLRTILLVNAGLDVGYIATAVWLLATAGERHERQGMGAGILVQGLFLLVYDLAFAADIGRWLTTDTV